MCASCLCLIHGTTLWKRPLCICILKKYILIIFNNISNIKQINIVQILGSIVRWCSARDLFKHKFQWAQAGLKCEPLSYNQDFIWQEIWRTSINLFKVRWNDHLVNYYPLMYRYGINTNLLHLDFSRAEFWSFRIKC